VEPIEPDPDHQPDGWEDKGDILYDARKISEALECYTRGLTEDPKAIVLWMKKAEIFIEEKRFRSGLFCVEKALHLNDTNPMAWLMRGYMLHNSGDNQGAIESMDYSLSLKGDNTDAWLEKGECLLDMEKFDEVRTCIQYLKDMEAHGSDVEVLSKDLDARIEAAKECPMCGNKIEEGSCPTCLADILLRDAKLSIDAGKEAEKDITEAEEILHEAEELFEKKFYGPTAKALKPMPDLLGDSWRPNAHALVILEEAEEIAMTLEADNMRGTMSIREKIEKVKEIIADGRPVKAVVEAEKALEHARKIAKKYSDLLLKEPERKKKVEIPADGSSCHSCGEEVESDWVKCPVCKITLKEPAKAQAGTAQPEGPATEPPKTSPPPSPDGDGLFCPKCGEEVETHWVRCLFCNTSLVSKGGK